MCVALYHSSSLVPSYIWSGNEAAPAFRTGLRIGQSGFLQKLFFFFIFHELQGPSCTKYSVRGNHQANSNCSQVCMALFWPQCQDVFLHSLYAYPVFVLWFVLLCIMQTEEQKKKKRGRPGNEASMHLHA